MEVTNWEISGYKTIVDPQAVSTGKVNVLVGKNNSGKSVFLDSLLDFKHQYGDPGSSPAWGSRTISAKEENAIRYKLTFGLDNDEKQEVLTTIKEFKNLSEKDIEVWKQDGNFDSITYIWNGGHGKGSGRSIFTTTCMGRTIPIYFANHANTRRYGWMKLDGEIQIINDDTLFDCYRRLIKESVRRWKSISAFRNPDNLCEINYNMDLDENGQNLAQVLHTVRNNHESIFHRISDEYSKIMEGVDRIRTPIKNGRRTTVAAIEPGLNFESELKDISSGSKEVLTLITQVILAEDETDILFLEEPELHLHPEAERKVLDLITEVASNDGPQVFISTHSEVMVDDSHADTIIRVDRDEETGKSSYYSVVGEGPEEILMDLGYNNSSLYQASAVAFVEGRSDQAILSTSQSRLVRTSACCECA